MGRHGMFRLALGLAAVRGAAGDEQEAFFEYSLVGKEFGGQCIGGTVGFNETTSDQWDCERRCSQESTCGFYSFRQGDSYCFHSESCDKQVKEKGQQWNAYKKGDPKNVDWTEAPTTPAPTEAPSTTVISSTVTVVTTTLEPLDPEADMVESPVRTPDIPNDQKVNNLTEKLAKSKPDETVSNLVQAMCPGAIDIAGDGPAYLVNTVWNLGDDHAGEVKVEEGRVAPYMSGRTYFAEACNPGMYNHNEYLAMNLLGKRFSFTVDLTDAGCGCNAALYLTNLRQNSNVSECQDFYCDANNVCGVSCAEVDIMEANQHAWHSTLHTATDRDGAAVGYGGGGPGWSGPRDWIETEYGPGGKCVDTTKPFRADVYFPVDRNGILRAMDVVLWQLDMPCAMRLSLNKYEGMEQMTEALKAGMTPIISYWAADDMTWMDGAGDDMQGPCIKDDASKCGAKVQMYDFEVATLKNGYQSPVVEKPKTTTPSPEKKKAVKKQLAKELKAQQKEQQKENAGDQQGDWDQQNDWEKQDNDWEKKDQQGNDWEKQQGNDLEKQEGDWNQEGQQQQGDEKQGKDGSNGDWGEPWADWDHSRPQPGQVWDGAGRPVEEGEASSTTTTPCEDVDSDPVHCRPKLPGDPNRDGLKDKKDATDADYLFKKNEALGPILRGSGSMAGAASAALVAGFACLMALLAFAVAWRGRTSAWQSPPAAPDAVTAAETSPQRGVSLLRAAPSSQSLLTLSPETV